jgi:hypothetical protein
MIANGLKNFKERLLCHFLPLRTLVPILSVVLLDAHPDLLEHVGSCDVIVVHMCAHW